MDHELPEGRTGPSHLPSSQHGLQVEPNASPPHLQTSEHTPVLDPEDSPTLGNFPDQGAGLWPPDSLSSTLLSVLLLHHPHPCWLEKALGESSRIFINFY